MGNWIWAILLVVAGIAGWQHGEAPSTEPAPFGELLSEDSSSLLGQRARLNRQASTVLKVPITSVEDRLTRAIERSETKASFEIQLLIARWFEHDRIALREWACSQTRPVQDLVIRHWMHEDRTTMWITERHSSGSSWNEQIDRLLAREFPEYFFETGENNRIDKHSFERQIPTAIENLARKDFAKAAAIASEPFDGSAQTHQQAIAALAKVKLEQTNFDEAFAWAGGVERFPEDALATIIDSVAENDLEEALRLFQENIAGEVSYTAYSKTSTALRALPLEEGMALLRRYQLPFHLRPSFEGLSRDPIEAISILESFGYDRTPSMWLPEPSVAALDSMAPRRDEPLHSAMISQTLNALLREDRDAAVAWIATRPSTEEQSLYAARLAGGWGSNESSPELLNLIDFNAIKEHQDSGLHRGIQSNVAGAAQRMAAQDPHAAIAQAEQLENGELRARAYRTIAKIWFEHDEQATIDWLHELPPEDQKGATKYTHKALEEAFGN